MTSTVSIRPISDGDQTLWAPLWAAYLAFYETSRDQAQFDLTFARLVDPARADMFGWLAMRDQQAIGLVHVIVHPHCWQDAPVTYLQDLYADPSVRGSGVGRKLIETVYDDADAAGRPNVYWTTQTFNDTARRLYDRIASATDFMKYSRS